MKRATRRVRLACAWALLSPVAGAATLYSTADGPAGVGTFHGPGAYMEESALFPVVIRNMIWVTERDFATPFENNGARPPNTSGETEFHESQATGVDPALRAVDGRLSNGVRVNENVDVGVARIAGTEVLFAVVEGGSYNGAQLAVAGEDGQIVMSMDLAMDLGIGPKGVARLAFSGTTGTVVVPQSLQTQAGGKGVDQAGRFPSGTRLTGRVGDFNHDGRIDGTLVSALTLPLDAPLYPGQPFVIVRHFDTDMPIAGARFGDVHGLLQKAAPARGR